jgi:hypothetical protein
LVDYGIISVEIELALGSIVAISAITLAITATGRPENDIATGWSYATFWIGFNRMTLPFFAGLLLFRTGKLIRIPMAYLLCSLALIVLFMLPKTAFLLDAAEGRADVFYQRQYGQFDAVNSNFKVLHIARP